MTEQGNEHETDFIPDLYADRVRISVTVFGVNFTFGLGSAHPEEDDTKSSSARELVRVRMSPTHAKVFAMLLRKQLKAYEQDNDTTIKLPKQLLEALEFSEEDW